ncbi:MAG: YggS family pyridoxal phosphate-dependent enzyme [Burkholderiales bacterium]|nr:YggS family pyridoxal phosphate-dependent enzyme [Burkholderiales bacterium]
MMSISENLQLVQHRIATSAQAAGRDPTSITLLAVSKTFDAQAVLTAAQAGQRAFGENYVQEAIDKILVTRELNPNLQLEWHFIGPIQSNKTRQIAEHFDWVHSVDRLKIAQRLSEQRPADMPPLQICLQVNVSGEATKSGLEPDALLELAREVNALPNLRLRGLMAIPEPTEDVEQQRAAFAKLRLMQNDLQAVGIPTDTLSMGMSADMDAAIAEGATIVRIGTAIFGGRDYAK